MKLNIWAVAAMGKGISGGDRIFIELSRRWSKKFPIVIYTWKEGILMCERQGLIKKRNLGFHEIKIAIPSANFFFNYVSRILAAVREACIIRLENDKAVYLYSASDFWMDTLPAFILKKRFPKTLWIAGWYQTAPKPWVGFKMGNRERSYRLSAALYWLMQLPMKPLVKRYADFVLVNNEDERKQFSRLDRQKKVVVVLGAVNLKDRDEYKKKFRSLPKKYDGVFQGRFHPQKGVVELVDIWKKMVDKKPAAKLAMIGDGPLMDDVKRKINENNLEKNIKLFGYLFDGPEKYRIFCQSKVVVHPSFYDSGGMAAAEAMMFGLPAVGFDLNSYKSYYPKGMIKVRKGDTEVFATKILELLKDDKVREKIAAEGLKMIESNWSWDKRAQEVLDKLK